MNEEIDWDPIHALVRQVLRQGAPLVLTDDVRDLLRRTAREVALDAADVSTEASALAVLRECSRRITEGSNRLGDALHRMYRLRDKGDYDTARQEMRDVLSVEVVPLYRQIAQGQLAAMADKP
ncbi:DUSAM domain-containing protein [Corallococcus sp. ZKHCc1 1396]|uniref:DUSAM domain-containing protein n=1 Tax=Corallococcus soli TaxID=2710757 RepID=A0ABR9Q0H7_9BACT|nr:MULTISPECIES: DUSAM domain-containing protein [Corallococcus]MBE4753677.1 DUSAM domain-containing protein [Corallococcus soli]MCY1035161.1 DUSAM domain-containing protein [Corallococcus sp. BB11-1]